MCVALAHIAMKVTIREQRHTTHKMQEEWDKKNDKQKPKISVESLIKKDESARRDLKPM